MRGTNYLRALFLAAGLAITSGVFTAEAFAQSVLKSLYAENLDLNSRMIIQDDLIWVGEYNGVIDGEIGSKTIAGIKAFQRAHRLPADGVLDRRTYELLSSEAGSARASAGFGMVLDEESGIRIGLPKTYLGPGKPTGRGTVWKHATEERFSVETIRISEYGRTLEELYDELLKVNGKSVTYKTQKYDWFVISGERKKDGKKYYTRYKIENGDIRGFSVTFDSRHSERYERFVIAMTNSFEPFAIPAMAPKAPELAAVAPDAGSQGVDDNPQIGNAVSPAPSAPTTPPASPGVDAGKTPPPEISSSPKPDPEMAAGGPSEPLPAGGPKPFSSGSGFVVSPHSLVTNAHVVEGCEEVVVGILGVAKRVIEDSANDLALIFIEDVYLPPPLPVAAATPGLGEQVLALGYPLRSLLAESLNATVGNVSSMAGVGNDVRYLQMTAAVQPGNSGGPLMNLKGEVVGVVTSKLNALVVASKTGDIPQSVNFAIKANVMRMFLEANGIPSDLPISTNGAMTIPEVAEKARKSVLPLICMK